MHANKTSPVAAGTIGAARPAARRATAPGSEFVLPMPAEVRERLVALYRERDAAANGRVGIWADCLEPLERGEEVYESFRVLASAGVEMPDAARRMLGEMPYDWQQICLIDPAGVVRTASVNARKRAFRS